MNASEIGSKESSSIANTNETSTDDLVVSADVTNENALEKLIEIARSCEFDEIGVTPASTLRAMPEVRAMCAADKCHAFAHSWSCPPGCGDISEYQALFGEHETCVVVQSVGNLEDDFDFEGMMEVEAIQKDRFMRMCELVRESFDGCVFLASGTCKVCEICTYPDSPCRFPEKRFTSMEAAGLVVSEVCTNANVPYNHGKGTITFTSCVLL